MFRQEWDEAIRSKERFHFYHSFKCSLDEELYLSHVNTYCFRVALTQFRLGVLPINNNMFRYDNLIVKRNCPVCNVPEDEEHIFVTCKLYASLRSKVFTGFPIPVTARKALTLVDATSCKTVTKYVFLAMKIRKRTFNQ